MSANRPDSSSPGKSDDGPATLVVFLRRPVPGVGKRRIAADLGAITTCTLANHLLATTLEDAAAWPGPVVLAPASKAEAAWAGELLSRAAAVIPQPEGNLGQRINAVDECARNAGHTRLIYIGSDAPVLDVEYFADAATSFATHDVVLGPADDGGVTLMGARRAWPKLAALPWSDRNLGRALELACVDAGLTVDRLAPRYDIDFVADLPRLGEDLALDARPARQKLRRWLVEMKLTESAPVVARCGAETGTR